MSKQDSKDIRDDDRDDDREDTQAGNRQGADQDIGNQQGLRASGPDSLSGFVADDDAGDSSIGAANADGSRQSGIQSNFAKASPESNVGPAGAPQTSHGNAGGPITGGVLGKSEAQNSQSAIGGAANGGAGGTSAGGAKDGYVGRASDDQVSKRLADGAESSGTPGDGPHRTS